jgi:hypothetical protein
MKWKGKAKGYKGILRILSFSLLLTLVDFIASSFFLLFLIKDVLNPPRRWKVLKKRRIKLMYILLKKKRVILLYEGKKKEKGKLGIFSTSITTSYQKQGRQCISI